MENRHACGEWEAETRRLVPLVGVSLLGGLLIGLIGAAFRYLLTLADSGRTLLLEFAGERPWMWVPVALAIALSAALARWLVRLAPLAAGSGVQHVEAVMRGEALRAPLLVLPVKFFGGLLAIGSGLALGREGPTVQMGATIGSELSVRSGISSADHRDAQAAIAGAGLAVAFNAPLGGAAFVFEEVARSFRPRLVMAVLIACGTAIAVSRALLGDAPDFSVGALAQPPPTTMPVFFLLGALLGALGVFYNQTTILAIDTLASRRLGSMPPESRAALVGVAVAIIGLAYPASIGGGDPLNQTLLTGGIPAATVAAIVLLRWVLGPLSYAAGTPGGLFAPLLVLGSALGILFANALDSLSPGLVDPTALAVVGMTAFFTGVVRAPITGILLICEMTATTALIPPMLFACFGSMLVTSWLRGPPVYDTLRRRMLRSLPPSPSNNSPSA